MAKPKNRTKKKASSPTEENRGDASVPPVQRHQHTRRRSLLRSPAARRARAESEATGEEVEVEETLDTTSEPAPEAEAPQNRKWPEDRRTATNPPYSLAASIDGEPEAAASTPPAAGEAPPGPRSRPSEPARAGTSTGIALAGSVGLALVGAAGALVLLLVALAAWWMG